MTHSKLSIHTSNVSNGNMSFLWGNHAAVLENRRRFLKKHDLELAAGVAMHTQGGDSIVVANSSHRSAGMESIEMAIECDALITQSNDLFLFLLTADCIPLTLFDQSGATVALAHLGWKSVDLQLAQKVVSTMVSKFDCDTSTLHAHIGPCIHQSSYIITHPEQRHTQSWLPYLQPVSADSYQVDILGYTIAQLRAAGLEPKNITIDPTDTALSMETFSHYRSQLTGETEGRFATVAALK